MNQKQILKNLKKNFKIHNYKNWKKENQIYSTKKRYQLDKKGNENINKKKKKDIINSSSDTEIKSQPDEDSNKKIDNDTIPNIFLKDKDNNDKKYTFHRIDKKYYYLRYTDRKCNGSAKYNTLFAIII